jgi:hypothetical protein
LFKIKWFSNEWTPPTILIFFFQQEKAKCFFKIHFLIQFHELYLTIYKSFRKKICSNFEFSPLRGNYFSTKCHARFFILFLWYLKSYKRFPNDFCIGFNWLHGRSVVKISALKYVSFARKQYFTRKMSRQIKRTGILRKHKLTPSSLA